MTTRTNNRQKQRDIWDQAQRSRASFFSFVGRETRQAFNRQFKGVTDKLPDQADQLSDAFIDEIIRDEEMFTLFELIYFEVGRRFAREVFNNLHKQQFDDDIFRSQVNGILNTTGGDMIKGITVTSKTRIKKIVANAFAQGLPVNEIGLQISKGIDDMNFKRATSIARTEVIRASNFGALTGANMSGLELNKEWISTLDARIRSNGFDHIAADGQIVDKDMAFTVSGEKLNFPLDFSGSAGNTINCRCTLAFIAK